jgi:predicted enzyme related to lactoylglutathione lyase
MKTRLPIVPASGWCAALALGLCAATSLANGSPDLRVPPLSNTGSGRLPGKFVWADLVTDDVAGARKFYGHLFDWSFENAGDYTIAKNQDRPLCGMFQRQRPAGSTARPQWIGYLSVRNVPKAQRAVTEAGGKVLAQAWNVPDRGEQAVFSDPEGAVFGVIKSSSGDPQDFLPEPGDWIWVQLLSQDARKACAFYESVAGYQIVENLESPRPNDFVLASEGYARAAILTIPDSKSEVRPNWLPFVRVTNVSDSLAKVKDLGGRILISPKPELLGGRLAVIADPTGAAIGILEWSQDGKNGER